METSKIIESLERYTHWDFDFDDSGRFQLFLENVFVGCYSANESELDLSFVIHKIFTTTPPTRLLDIFSEYFRVHMREADY